MSLDLPVGAELEIGNEMGVRIGALRYTGLNLGDAGGDNTLQFELSTRQRAALGLAAGSSDAFPDIAAPLDGLDSVLSGLEELGQQLATLPPDQAFAFAGQALRGMGGSLLASQAGLLPGTEGLPEVNPALLEPFSDTLDTLLEHFYYERPGELGLKNLELQVEATGSAASQYRYRTAAGDEIFAETSRAVSATSDDALGMQVRYFDGGASGGASLEMLYHQRASSSSTSFNSFTVGLNRWSLAVSQIERDLEFSLQTGRYATHPATEAGTSSEERRERQVESRQVESRIWALRRVEAAGWETELGAGVGRLHSERTERGAQASEGSGFNESWSASDSRTNLGLGLLAGARRATEYTEAGARAIAHGRLRQQLTAAAGARLPLGRLGLVGDLQADWVRQPDAVWDREAEDFRLAPVMSARFTPTAALVWSLEAGALSGLHSWQAPFENRARLRDPRHLPRALFAGSAGHQGEELFAGYSFGRSAYLSAAARQEDGFYRHYTLSGRARSLKLEAGLGSGQSNGLSVQDGRKRVGLSYLQFLYNRDGERFVSLTLDPERRGLDVTMATDSASLARSLNRAWSRVRRLFRV